MSIKNTYTIRCPKCQEEQSVELYDSVNVVDYPQLRDELMGNTLNAVTCAQCGFQFRVDKRLLYNDPDRRVMVYWFPGNEELYHANQEEFMKSVHALNAALPEDFDPPVIHLVFHRTELVERIFLLEEGLNERIVEYIKYMMYSRNPEKLKPTEKMLLFNAEDSTDKALRFVIQDMNTRQIEGILEFDRQAYNELETMFDDDTKTASLMELFPGPYISARSLLARDEAETPDKADG